MGESRGSFVEKEGWVITDDPLSLRVGERDLFVDLGAEKLIAAERGDIKIAVEIKSFISQSLIKDLENAIGQYILYLKILTRLEPERTLYLAVNQEIFTNFFAEEVVQIILSDGIIKLIIFDALEEEITQWID
ncbi:element excision factor XisH family protein [Spirulina sp. CS-785/01]|uniref:element excision factor XisH family protein n=1 Tax=Spirulina sp. CS-785/01 TaxID=3021716 RepID=UPI003FA7BCDF